MSSIESRQLRQTFLRHHVDRVRRRGVFTDDWEVVESLRDLERADDDPTRLTLEWFLFGDDSEFPDPLYLPVALDSVRRPANYFPSLTDLLKNLLLPQTPLADRRAGVVIEGASGSGKTVSLHRAFFDCFRAAAAGGTPPLAGYSPCWIDHLPDGRCATWPDLLSGLASEGAPRPLPPDRVPDWVRHGPPLLLLCDLDAVPDKAHRGRVAGLLQQFCREQIRGTGSRSCCVIACSGLDSSAESLLEDRNFERYRLLPWSRNAARSYATRWRDAARTPADGPAEPATDDPWIGRDRLPGHVHQMLALPARPKPPATEGALLHAWVDSRREQLRAALPDPARPPVSGGVDSWALALATRLALPFYHGPQRRRDLSEDELQSYVRSPDWPKADWHPRGPAPWSWTQPAPGDYCPYFQNPPDSPPHAGDWLCGLVRERSPFLRGGGRAVRFVGGLADYFEGVMATRFWKRPFQPLLGAAVRDEHWHRAVLYRWGHAPERFTRAARLLGGVLVADDLCRLLKCYLRSRTAPPVPRLLPLLEAVLSGARTAFAGEDRVTAAWTGLRDLLDQNVPEEEVVGKLRDWFEQSAPEYLNEYCRLAGLEGAE